MTFSRNQVVLFMPDMCAVLENALSLTLGAIPFLDPPLAVEMSC